MSTTLQGKYTQPRLYEQYKLEPMGIKINLKKRGLKVGWVEKGGRTGNRQGKL